ncbi:MAG TPA: O-antigen ligase family protein [Verrucomicrobiae bacterium]|nr:O-antigen ligase family protein [Verrucomicrobiae bacterium]
MNRESLDTWCERGILGLVLAILIYGPLATGAVRTPDFLVLQGLTMGVMLLWGFRLWLKPRPQLLWPPICWAVVAFTIYAIIRYATADLEYAARGEMVQALMYAFLFLAILNNLYRQEYAQTLALVLVFLAMGIAAYAIYQFATGSDRVWTFIKPYKHRGSGTFISPNDLAGFLEMILPLGLAVVLIGRAKPALKVFVGYAALVILGGIAVSLSRGSWISVGLVLVILFALLISYRAYRIPSIALLIVLIGAGIYLAPRAYIFKVRVDQFSQNDRFNDSARLDLWEPAVRLWKENIWWGIGPNHYNYRFREFRPQSEQYQPDRVHNDYLNTLTDYGIVGFALVLSAFVLLFWGVRKTWPYVRKNSGDLGSGNSNKFAILVGASLGLIAILLHSVVDFNMHIPSNAILAVSLMALLASAVRFATDNYWIPARMGFRLLATVLIAAGLGYLGWEGNRAFQEYAWLNRANHQPEYSPAQAEALQKAFAVEPNNFETANRIGEIYRVQSWNGGAHYDQLARTAMDWFERGMKLNPYDGYNYLKYGMCLDWLDQTKKSGTYYDKAVKLDPNGYFTAAYVGWHYFQTGDYAAARTWFDRSMHLEGNDNKIASSYLTIVNARMIENATNRLGRLRFGKTQ